MRSKLPTIALFLILFPVLAANSSPIIQDQQNFCLQIEHFWPIGQTFTAEDPWCQYIGFGISVMNPQCPVVPITVELFEGATIQGPPLGTAQLLQIQSGTQFLDADFSSVPLKVGQTYTALLSTSNPRAGVCGIYWKSHINNEIIRPDPYLGGRGFDRSRPLDAPPTLLGEYDFMFRVLPVPEPATILLLGLGVVMVRRKRKK